jgi:hypothetical protein
MARVNEPYTPIKPAAKTVGPIRQWLADKIRPKDEPPAAAQSAPPVSAEKPAAGKPHINWAKLAAQMEASGAGSGVDRGGQVLNPSSGQRSTQSWLSGMFPRGPGI